MLNKDRQIIYIGITKTASESVYTSLFRAGLVDNKKHKETEGYKQYQVRNHRLKKHQSIRFIENNFEDVNLSDYFKFTFVREPYARHLSMYNWYRKRLPRYAPKEMGLLSFTKGFLRGSVGGSHVPKHRYMAQVAWLKNHDHKINMDSIGRFETLEEDFATVAKILGIKPELEKKNVSSPGNRLKLADYCSESEDLVRKYYEEDFDVFGYSKKLKKEK